MRPEEYDEILGTVTAALRDYQTMTTHRTDARTLVRALLEEIRTIAHSPRVNRAADSIEQITLSYMEPSPAHEWYRYGVTGKEQAILELLHAHLGRPMTKETISRAIYHDRPDTMPEIKIIDVFICRIRRDRGFGPKGHAPFEIQTIWGRGYKLVHRAIPQPVAEALQKLVA